MTDPGAETIPLPRHHAVVAVGDGRVRLTEYRGGRPLHVMTLDRRAAWYLALSLLEHCGPPPGQVSSSS